MCFIVFRAETLYQRLVFSTFLSCSQMSVGFYHSVIHRLGFLLSNVEKPEKFGTSTGFEHCGWLLLKCSAVGIGFNGAETNCGIAHILGILLMNSYNIDIFFSNTRDLAISVRRSNQLSYEATDQF